MSYDASMYELMQFRKQMEETEKLPLAERKANAVEWFRALNEDHMGVAQKVGWLLYGNYGGGSYASACRVLASPRMNQVAWCAITIANLEYGCPAKFATEAWKRLSIEKRYLVNEAIRQEIADAKAEGYCGEIKNNPMGSNVFKRELIKFIEDTYEKRDEYNYPANARWLNRVLGKIKRLPPGVYPVRKIQNMLRDWRDEDPGNNDNYWYLVIDRIAKETGIGPQ